MKNIEKGTLPKVCIRYFPQIRGDDADLIFEFFMVYSRFEFALKQVGFRNNDRGYLLPNWRAFSLEVQAKFIPSKSPELQQAFDYYLSRPPNIQVEENGRLRWRENRKRNNETEFAWVTRSIGIARNNLFHGGKFPWDQVRNTTLLSHGLIILYECLELDNRVNRTFFEYPETMG